MIPEWFRLVSGALAYGLCCHTPLHRAWPIYLHLLPAAGDWAYRKERHLYRRTFP